jgi:hypothetical protein
VGNAARCPANASGCAALSTETADNYRKNYRKRTIGLSDKETVNFVHRRDKETVKSATKGSWISLPIHRALQPGKNVIDAIPDVA